MHNDRWGLQHSAAGRDAVDRYDEALLSFLEYRLSAGGHLKAALAADPALPMGLCMRGYMLLQLATNAVTGKVDQAIASAEPSMRTATPRERLHFEALQCWRRGDVDGAIGRWRAILETAPQDLLALRLHHFMSFWRGARNELRDVPATAIAAVSSDIPGYGFILGMQAFGLEETGDYVEAEAAGREAVARNADDLWAIHAVAHVLEMQGRTDDGMAWLDYPAGTWSDRNPFRDHVWWHAALFALEHGDDRRVLKLYDREIRVDENGFYLDVQNATSLLMRLVLSGVDVGDRWQPLADLAEIRTGDHVMAFTDAHYMMALVGAGRLDAARHYLDSLREFASSGRTDAARVAAALTVPLAEALLDYGEARYAPAAMRLAGLIDALAPLGGSHAQQDIFRQILIDAAIRGGCDDLAAEQARIRLTQQPKLRWLRRRPAPG
jgi:hypothetical protein